MIIYVYYHMVARAKRGFGRRFRKRRLVRRPKLMKNPLGSGISNQNRKLRIRFEGMVPVNLLNTAAGTIAATQYCFPLNFPTMHRNSAGTYVQIPNVITDVWPKFFGAASIFDQYKVLGLRAKFMPSEVETIVSTAVYNIVDSPAVVYQVNDNDDVSLITGAASIIEAKYLNSGAMPRHYTDGRSVHFKYRQLPEKRKVWRDTNVYAQDPGATPDAGDAVSEGTFGSMKICFVNVGSGVGVAANIGRLYVSWDVIFRGIFSNA